MADAWETTAWWWTDKFLSRNKVLVWSFQGKEKWNQGKVIMFIRPLAYQIWVGEWTCHIHLDHLPPAGNSGDTPIAPAPEDSGATPEAPDTGIWMPMLRESVAVPSIEPQQESSKEMQEPEPVIVTETPSTPMAVTTPVRRYPRFTTKPVKRLNLWTAVLGQILVFFFFPVAMNLLLVDSWTF